MPDNQFSPRPWVGVAVLVWNEGRLLLGRRINADAESCWQFPGGHLDYGEDVLDCARREVQEETGLEIHQLKPVAYTSEVFMSGGRHYITLYASAQLLCGEAEVREPDKCECWQWFLPSSLPAPLFTPITNLLKRHPDLWELA